MKKFCAATAVALVAPLLLTTSAMAAGNPTDPTMPGFPTPTHQVPCTSSYSVVQVFSAGPVRCYQGEGYLAVNLSGVTKVQSGGYDVVAHLGKPSKVRSVSLSTYDTWEAPEPTRLTGLSLSAPQPEQTPRGVTQQPAQHVDCNYSRGSVRMERPTGGPVCFFGTGWVYVHSLKVNRIQANNHRVRATLAIDKDKEISIIVEPHDVWESLSSVVITDLHIELDNS